MPWTPSKDPAIQSQWQTRLAEWRVSGQSIQAFVADRDYSAASLRLWRRWFEERPGQAHGLIELHVQDPLREPPQDAMVVELCHGRLIHLRPGFDTDSVARLVTTLEQL